MTRPARCRSDAGQVGGIEALPFGILVFVVGILLVANAWGVVDANIVAAAAAEAGARTYVEVVTGDDPSVAFTAASAAARDVVDGHGRDPARLALTIEPQRAVTRCTRIVVEATYRVPAISLPWVGGFGDAITVHSRHSEIVDPFRDGVSGEANCA